MGPISPVLRVPATMLYRAAEHLAGADQHDVNCDDLDVEAGHRKTLEILRFQTERQSSGMAESLYLVVSEHQLLDVVEQRADPVTLVVFLDLRRLDQPTPRCR